MVARVRPSRSESHACVRVARIVDRRTWRHMPSGSRICRARDGLVRCARHRQHTARSSRCRLHPRSDGTLPHLDEDGAIDGTLPRPVDRNPIERTWSLHPSGVAYARRFSGTVSEPGRWRFHITRALAPLSRNMRTAHIRLRSTTAWYRSRFQRFRTSRSPQPAHADGMSRTRSQGRPRRCAGQRPGGVRFVESGWHDRDPLPSPGSI